MRKPPQCNRDRRGRNSERITPTVSPRRHALRNCGLGAIASVTGVAASGPSCRPLRKTVRSAARHVGRSGRSRNRLRSQSVLRFGAPGRTRTSTMLPLPDFESGASTNSATGAGGRNIAAKRGGSTAPHLLSVPRPSERPSSAMRHKFAREREPGPRAPRHALAFSPRWSVRVAPRSTQVGFTRLASSKLLISGKPEISVSRSLSSGRASRGLARDTRERRISPPGKVTSAPAPSPHSRVRHRRSCRPGPRALAPARRPSGRRDPARTSPRPACPRGA